MAVIGCQLSFAMEAGGGKQQWNMSMESKLGEQCQRHQVRNPEVEGTSFHVTPWCITCYFCRCSMLYPGC